MGAADVLQPILAAVGHDPEHPGVEASANFREMLVRLDEGKLQDVFGHIRATRHAQRVAIKRVTVPGNEYSELLAVSREHTLDDALIRVVLINEQFWLRRPHDDRVTQISRPGQGRRPTSDCISGRHVLWTRRPRAP